MNETEVSRNVTDRLSPAELRIGNILKICELTESAFAGQNATVIGIYDENELYVKEGGYYCFDELEGIKINDEILNRFMRLSYDGLDYCVIHPIINFKIRRPSFDNVDFYSYCYTDDENTGRFITLTYIHELQNLYFAMCGEELEINGL